MSLVFIGDVHGHIEKLSRIIKACSPEDTIFQVGDMGVGFYGTFLPHYKEKFRWIRGNHDDPKVCVAHPNYLGDYGVMQVEGYTVFYLGGAYSIDHAFRKEDVSWWKDEELSYRDFISATALYAATKPDLVITHECPTFIAQEIISPMLIGSLSNDERFGKSKTSDALQCMFEMHAPEHWVFGHHHINKDFHVRGTRFHCCGELSTYRLEGKNEIRRNGEVDGRSGGRSGKEGGDVVSSNLV